MNKRYDRILDYFFRRQDLPEDIRRRFERWMLDREDSPELDEALLGLWNGHTAYATDDQNAAGLARLHAAIRPEPRRHAGRRLLRRIATTAAAVLIFAGGYQAARFGIRPRSEITLLTAEGNVGEFTLPDGTHVWLNGKSRLRFPAEFSDRSREVTLSGEAFFEVMKDSLRPFRVAMSDLKIEVLGTSFDAIGYAAGSHEQIILKTGSVRVLGGNTAAPITLRPDEKLSFDRYSKTIAVEHVDARNYCRWFESRLVFDNTPLADIVTNLERRYNVEISVSTHLPVRKRLSMVVCHESLEDIMEVMATLVPIRYSIDGNHVLITSK